MQRVDLRTHQTASGEDYYRINPKGSVPLLETDEGMRLTEGPIIAQYIADKTGNAELMPPAGTDARYRVMEWQNYITSELHKSYSLLFNPAFDASAKGLIKASLRKNMNGSIRVWAMAPISRARHSPPRTLIFSP